MWIFLVIFKSLIHFLFHILLLKYFMFSTLSESAKYLEIKCVLLFLATHLCCFIFLYFEEFFLRAYIWLNLIYSNIKGFKLRAFLQEDLHFFCPRAWRQDKPRTMLATFKGLDFMNVRFSSPTMWGTQHSISGAGASAPRATLICVYACHLCFWIYLTFLPSLPLSFFFLSLSVSLSVCAYTLLEYFLYFFGGQKCNIKFVLLVQDLIIAKGPLRVWARSRKCDLFRGCPSSLFPLSYS